jgi:hypothetical protein
MLRVLSARRADLPWLKPLVDLMNMERSAMQSKSQEIAARTATTIQKGDSERDACTLRPRRRVWFAAVETLLTTGLGLPAAQSSLPRSVRRKRRRRRRSARSRIDSGLK